ncbi:hypothetical protein CsatB_024352 [Cannabis sativa]
MAANLAVGNSRTGYNNNRNNNFRTSYQQGRLHSNETARNSTKFPPRYPNSNSRPVCQVCLKVGHTASICHYRFEKHFVTPKNNFHSPKAYIAEQESPEVNDPQAYSTASLPEFGDDIRWYVDTGATNHVSLGMEHLDSATPYQESETLAVGDGQVHGEGTGSRET